MSVTHERKNPARSSFVGCKTYDLRWAKVKRALQREQRRELSQPEVSPRQVQRGAWAPDVSH